jgi:hypothetical protein
LFTPQTIYERGEPKRKAGENINEKIENVSFVTEEGANGLID